MLLVYDFNKKKYAAVNPKKVVKVLNLNWVATCIKTTYGEINTDIDYDLIMERLHNDRLK